MAIAVELKQHIDLLVLILTDLILPRSKGDFTCDAVRWDPALGFEVESFEPEGNNSSSTSLSHRLSCNKSAL